MKFQIYSKDNCQFCSKAVALLTIKGLSFEELKLGREFTRDQLLKQFPEAKTFPQIKLASGEYIGGYNDLVSFLEE